MQANGQPVPISWLQSPDGNNRPALTEYTRAIVGSLASGEDGDQGYRPIHSARIRSAFASLGAPELYRLGLRLLYLLNEVQQLPGGFWLPTPYRVVQFGSLYAFVGAVPSQSGILASAMQIGLARFIPEALAAHFPTQSLRNWMGLPADLLSVADAIATLVTAHRRYAKPTASPSSVQYFKVQRGGASTPSFAWVPDPHAALAKERIAICREKISGSYRYFSSEIAGGRILTEAPIGRLPSRLLFALARHLGAPVQVTMRLQQAFCSIDVPESLPLEEYRLATILAESVLRSGRGTTYIIDCKLAETLVASLNNLGCSTGVLS